MTKVENSYKPRLKTILKQYHFNANRAQMNKYLVSTKYKFQEFAYGKNFAYVCKSIHMDRFAHVSIFAHVCKYAHVKAP